MKQGYLLIGFGTLLVGAILRYIGYSNAPNMTLFGGNREGNIFATVAMSATLLDFSWIVMGLGAALVLASAIFAMLRGRGA